MPARSVVIQLQPGIGQAILPDHRKMLPGRQYVVDWNTFQKLSNGARQNIIQVVSVNSDTTTTGSFVAAQTSTYENGPLSLNTILTTVSTTAIAYDLAGFAAQGFDGVAGIGVGPTVSGATVNNTLTGPAGERYMYVFNSSIAISGGQVAVWSDENNRLITADRPTYFVTQDGQGTEYQPAIINTATSPSTVGTKQGRFAGVALVTIPSGNFGWVQIEGLCPSVAVTGTVANGSTVAVGGSAVARVQASSASSAFANNVFGTVVASGSTAGGYYVVDIRSVKPKVPYTRILNKN